MFSACVGVQRATAAKELTLVTNHLSIASTMRPAHARGWALIVGALCLALCLALAACGGQGAKSAPPSGWTDITPPDSRQLARYVVSPDTPGLMLASIGGYTSVSAAPPLPAQLWRSRDGGASWQSLDNLHPPSGFGLLMPLGGHGLVFAQDPLKGALSMSDDAGTTWRTIYTTNPNAHGPVDEWTWLSGAVAIGGRLYAGGVAPGWGGMSAGTSRFAVSDDHGLTWRVIEASADPAGPNTITQAIAPLDATGATWLRLISDGSGPSTHAAVERSSDGGVTWRVLSPSLPAAVGLMQARFSTDTAHPGRVCAALTTWDITTDSAANPTATPTTSAFRGGAALAAAPAPPAPMPKDIALLVSDDGGATWRGGVVLALRRYYGGVVAPGAWMAADGSCAVATSQVGDMFSPKTSEKTTLWRLSAGATTVTAMLTMTDRGVLNVFHAPGGSGASERLIMLTRIPGPHDGQEISCGQGCTTYRDDGAYRLIWEPLPPA